MIYNQKLFFDLISVKFNSRIKLYEAPYCSGIKEGDEVVVPVGADDVAIGVVVTVNRTNEDSEILDTLCKHYGDSMPLPRIQKRIDYVAMVYEEDSKDEKAG